MAKIIGIDLGTTYSAVSIWDEKKKEPIILPNLGGFYTTPSIVSLNKAGEVIVGEDARRNQYAAPQDTVAEIKRQMGNDFKVMMRGQEFNPQTISAFILAYLKKCAEQYLGEPIYDAVITVPASFDVLQRNATREAGQIAGLNVLRLINEPTSAALAYGMMRGEEGQKTYAVYDLGGGKFDASIIQITADDVTVMGTSGNDRLGGLDMDEEVVKWILHEIQKKDGINLGRDEAVRQRLKVEVEGIKKALVVSENTILSVPNLAEINNQPYNLELPITLARFEMVIEPLLERSLVCLEDAVASARQENMVDWEDLDGILLVGGPTRLTRIRTMLKDKLKEHCPDKEPVVKMDLNPDEGVAMGAAILAAQLLPLGKPPEEITAMSPAGLVALRDMAWDERKISGMAIPGKELYDITSHSLGIAVEGTKFHKIIYKNSSLPISIAYGPFSNAAELMTELLVQVYQGEEEFVAANRLIGEVRIPDLPPLPRGGHMLEIKFSLGLDDMLLTVCKDLHTGREYNGTFKCDGVSRMSADDIQARRTQLIQMMKQGERAFAPSPRPAAAAPDR